MALEIVWSDEANEGLDEIIGHLEEKWTEKEIHKFSTRLEACLERSKKHHTDKRTLLESQAPKNISTLRKLPFFTPLMIKLSVFYGFGQT